MSAGPGLTGDKNFENSVEFFRKGDSHRTIVYGKTREEVLDRIAANYVDDSWMEHWVVGPTRHVPMGLGSQWTRAARRYDYDYHMI